jgi:hypothetical protein
VNLKQAGIFLFLFICLKSVIAFGQRDSLLSKIDSLNKKNTTTIDTSRGYKFRSFRNSGKELISKSLGFSPIKPNERPKVAFFRSVIFPGWGQITNKQFIKLPIIYGAAAVGGYFIYDNNKKFQEFKGYLQKMHDKGTTEIMIGNMGPYNESVINTAARQYRRWKQGTVIGFAAGWLLFAVEANVAAHMKTFDVSDDISMRISGGPLGQNAGIGLRMNLNLK